MGGGQRNAIIRFLAYRAAAAESGTPDSFQATTPIIYARSSSGAVLVYGLADRNQGTHDTIYYSATSASQRADVRGIYRRHAGVVYDNAATGTSVAVSAGTHTMAVSDPMVQRGGQVFGSSTSTSSTDYGTGFIRPWVTDKKALTIQTLPGQTDTMFRVFDDANATLFRVQADGKMLAAGGIGIGNSVRAMTLGTVVKKIQVFEMSGNSLGHIPIYDAIT